MRWRARAAATTIVCALVVGCGNGSDSTTGTDPATTSGSPRTSEGAATTTAATTTTAPTTNASTTVVSTTTPDASTTSLPDASAVVNVYWAWTIPTHYTTPERLGAGGRTVTEGDTEGDTEALVAAAVAELLEGPTALESDIGMMTAIPDGTELLGVVVENGTATIDLDATFAEPTGSLEELSRLAQVVFTATAIDGVERVRFAIDGAVADPVLSHGVIVGDGLTRNDFTEVRPLILVESPTPGDRLPAEPITVRGESNTFEATVQWVLAAGGGDGVIVDEGFTTASGGMGTWGTFEFEVDMTPYAGEQLSLVVFESSPEDGSQRNVVEIPITVDG